MECGSRPNVSPYPDGEGGGVGLSALLSEAALRYQRSAISDACFSLASSINTTILSSLYNTDSNPPAFAKHRIASWTAFRRQQASSL